MSEQAEDCNLGKQDGHTGRGRDKNVAMSDDSNKQDEEVDYAKKRNYEEKGRGEDEKLG